MGKLDTSGRPEAQLLALGATTPCILGYRTGTCSRRLTLVLTLSPLYAHLPAPSSYTCGHSWHRGWEWAPCLRLCTTCTSLDGGGETWGLALVSLHANDPRP